ncbi:MAG: FAD-dependent oxidoreductase [Rickettsiaceae bacterium]
MFTLNFGLTFDDLNSRSGLMKLDREFLIFLSKQNEKLLHELQYYRNNAAHPKPYSQFLLQLAPLIDDFIALLFDIEIENLSLKKKHDQFNPVYECRRKFIQRTIKNYPKDKLETLNFQDVTEKLQLIIGKNITELSIATAILAWQEKANEYQQELEIAAQYCALMVNIGSSLMLFDIPKPINENNHLRDNRIALLKDKIYLGFNYRDKENIIDYAYAQAKYCIYCHKQNKDSCAKGMSVVQKTISNNDKMGCPLGQKISEMNLLKSQGLNIAALAVIVIDNPLVAATGHRICNDCMKACIYQKQDPVNIPLVESNILTQVLNLPWGVEIYSLLTRWNPLNISQTIPAADTGYNVLVTGLGPAGFALSHYLLNEGHYVTAIDGLKIMPLHFDTKQPIKWWSEIKIPLSEKTPQGFGGVTEYGITNRWDKNNLSLIRLILERRQNFQIHGGIRLGSNISTEQAFAAGFNHIALCLGAGKPRFENLPGYFAKGVRTAADFLMSLQQGGAFLTKSNMNLLIRLPAVVIGCGLTAIDSAVELLHYYPQQVEKFRIAWQRKKDIQLNEAEWQIAQEFLAHAELFRTAKTDSEKLNIIQQIGGVTICYRNILQQSPAYRLNHEEIEHALALGIQFKQQIAPQEICVDQFGYAKKVKFTNNQFIEARSVLIAIGSEPNEFQDITQIDGTDSEIFKTQDKRISYFGDCNQKYAGNVVKALASAKNGYTSISKALNLDKPSPLMPFVQSMLSTVKSINLLSDAIVEIIIHSPMAVRNFQPGQFFKLQNYALEPDKVMKPLALTGAYVDKKHNTISCIVLEVGASSKLCRNLAIGEKVVLMGPTGAPTKIVKDKKVALIGGGLGNAVLLAIGQALRSNNCKIIYFAGYKQLQDRFHLEKIKEFADQIVWTCDTGIIPIDRPQDLSIKGNVVDGIIYAKNLKIIDNIEHVICIGSDNMMSAVSQLKAQLFGKVPMICSVNSPMQCMMKGICGQCIQKIDNAQGYIFTCAFQDQESKKVDFSVLKNRLQQNSLLEKMAI